jgi:hypothetical protein
VVIFCIRFAWALALISWRRKDLKTKRLLLSVTFVLSIWIPPAVAGDYCIDASLKLIEQYNDAMEAATNGNCKEAEAILRKTKKIEVEIGERATTPELKGVAERLNNIKGSVQRGINDARENGKCN